MIGEQSPEFSRGNLLLLSSLGLLSHARRFESFLERQCASPVDQEAQQRSGERDDALLFVLGLVRLSRLVVSCAEGHSLAPGMPDPDTPEPGMPDPDTPEPPSSNLAEPLRLLR